MSMPKPLMGNSICNEGPMNQPSLFDVLNTFSLKLMSVTSIPPLTPKWTPCARAVSVMADRSTTKVNNFFIIVFNICEVAKIQKKSEWSLFFHIFYELQSFLGAPSPSWRPSRSGGWHWRWAKRCLTPLRPNDGAKLRKSERKTKEKQVFFFISERRQKIIIIFYIETE